MDSNGKPIFWFGGQAAVASILDPLEWWDFMEDDIVVPEQSFTKIESLIGSKLFWLASRLGQRGGRLLAACGVCLLVLHLLERGDIELLVATKLLRGIRGGQQVLSNLGSSG